MIQPEILATIDHSGGRTWDRFANNLNTQLPRFISQFWFPGTETVDTFTFDWGCGVNWVCPPPYLILRTIQHATKTFTRGTLVIPAWSSAPFWPVLYPNGCEPVSCIKETVMLLKSQSVVLSGRSGWSLPSCDVLVIRFEFPASWGVHVMAIDAI